MSSIYRKGRDGYFYYQTYVYNPETRKRDKRVFHALRTKDINDAKSKQNELDLQYQKETDKDYNSLKSIVLIVIGTIIITIALFYLFMPINQKQNSSSMRNIEKKIKIDKKIDDALKTVEPIKEQNIEQANSQFEKVDDETKINSKQKLIQSEVLIPEYTIERVEKLSGAFKQGKVFVSIDQSSSYESQLLLCKDLAIRYSEFSSIVICLYSNNKIGKNLAKGINEFVSIAQQKQFWLAMYTYNSVEGEYFDNNPSSYLGNY